jgi:hypothetical protein
MCKCSINRDTSRRWAGAVRRRQSMHLNQASHRLQAPAPCRTQLMFLLLEQLLQLGNV